MENTLGVVRGLPPLSTSTNLTRGLAARQLFRVPHAAKALYIYKHPCLLRDSNPVPTTSQSASLTTIPDGRQIMKFDTFTNLSLVAFSLSQRGVTTDIPFTHMISVINYLKEGRGNKSL
ncbi:hypothetical protein TNCV_3828421 [Trichonephila clavipes]|nr:hypothetical protein TNCV_3828421 [Trichonephila clavipes]